AIVMFAQDAGRVIARQLPPHVSAQQVFFHRWRADGNAVKVSVDRIARETLQCIFRAEHPRSPTQLGIDGSHRPEPAFAQPGWQMSPYLILPVNELVATVSREALIAAIARKSYCDSPA